MLEFDTGTSLTPYPSLPGTFYGRIWTRRPIFVTSVKTVSMKGAKGRVKSYKFIEPTTGIVTNDLLADTQYNIVVKLESYPRYFHNTSEIVNDYGALELTSFEDANGRGRMWIPELRIDGEPATDKWVPLMSPEGAVCMVSMPMDADTGSELRNAKILVDGVDVHRYAPGDIYFCEECMCGSYTRCEFGEHYITVTKKDYNNFSKRVLLEDGDLVSIWPLMERTPRAEGQTEDAPPPSLKQQRATVKLTLYK